MGPSGPVHALAAGLWRELRAERGNLALSPYSVAVALAMTAHGARGATLDELLGVLDARLVEELDASLDLLDRDLSAQEDIELSAASALFGESSVEWEEPFLEELARRYAAGLRAVDLARDTEAARTVINDWTAARTRGRITDLVPPGAVDPLTRLVLVNALYLKAAWADPFPPEATEPRRFHLADGTTADVPFLRGHAFGHARGDGWQATRLPYTGSRLAMTVVLPDRGRLADLEEQVGGGGLPAVLGSVGHEAVDLSLPRWTSRTSAGLKPALARLGVATAFGRDADLSGMTTEEELFVGAVLHAVFVAVDEHGTEAAAATALTIRATGLPTTPVPMVVDRPFLFVIHDTRHHTPLFLGRVADPRP